MNNFVLNILAILIQLGYPGDHEQSLTALDYCDKECRNTSICEDGANCSKPVMNNYLHKKMTKELVDYGLSRDKAKKRAENYSYVRNENFHEAITRFYIIAQAIDDASNELTNSYCVDECKNKNCKLECKKEATWRSKKKTLAILMATLSFYESGGYRGNVHGAVPPYGIGDCKWQYPNGQKANPYARGASRVPGSCESFCMGQIRVGNGETYDYGWTAEEISGLDYISTRRCFMTMGNYLSKARNYCLSQKKENRNKDWIAATISLYGTGHSCDFPKLNKRAGLFWKYYSYKPDLSDDVKDFLDTNKFRRHYNLFYDTTYDFRFNREIK